MSSRHQQSRRRSYGRRQHEVRERRDRLEDLLHDEQGVPVLMERDSAADRLARLAFTAAPLGWVEGAA